MGIAAPSAGSIVTWARALSAQQALTLFVYLLPGKQGTWLNLISNHAMSFSNPFLSLQVQHGTQVT